METVRNIPEMTNTSGLAEGHLWIEELIDGDPLRFQMTEHGVLTFGGRANQFTESVPLKYQHATQAIRTLIQREPLQQALSDPSQLTIMGVAVHRKSTPYNWRQTPSFLGTDVFDEHQETYLPPDRTRQVLERIGLPAVNTFEREMRAQSFESQFDSMPASDWRDGPAAGIVIRNKTGDIWRIDEAFEHNWQPDPLTDLQTAVNNHVTRGWISQLPEQTPVSITSTSDLIECAMRQFARESSQIGVSTDVEGLRGVIAERVGRFQ